MREKLLKNLERIRSAVQESLPTSLDVKPVGSASVLETQLKNIDSLIAEAKNTADPSGLKHIKEQTLLLVQSELILALFTLRDIKSLIDTNCSLLDYSNYQADSSEIASLILKIDQADPEALKTTTVNAVKKSIQMHSVDAMLENLQPTIPSESKVPAQNAKEKRLEEIRSTAEKLQSNFLGLVKGIVKETQKIFVEPPPSKETQLINTLKQYQKDLHDTPQYFSAGTMSGLLQEYRQFLHDKYGDVPNAEVAEKTTQSPSATARIKSSKRKKVRNPVIATTTVNGVEPSISLEHSLRKYGELRADTTRLFQEIKDQRSVLQQLITQTQEKMPEHDLLEDPLIVQQHAKIDQEDEKIGELVKAHKQFNEEFSPLILWVNGKPFTGEQFNKAYEKYAPKGEQLTKNRVYEIINKEEEKFLNNITPCATALKKATDKITARILEILEKGELAELNSRYAQQEEKYNSMVKTIEETVQPFLPVEQYLLTTNKRSAEKITSAELPQESIQSKLIGWFVSPALTQTSISHAPKPNPSAASGFEQEILLGQAKLHSNPLVKEYGDLVTQFNLLKNEKGTRIGRLSSNIAVGEYSEKNLLKCKIQAMGQVLKRLEAIVTPIAHTTANLGKTIKAVGMERKQFADTKAKEVNDKYEELLNLLEKLNLNPVYAAHNFDEEWDKEAQAASKKNIDHVTSLFPEWTTGIIELKSSFQIKKLAKIEQRLKSKIEEVNRIFLQNWKETEEALAELNNKQDSLPTDLRLNNENLTLRLAQIVKPDPSQLNTVYELSQFQLEDLNQDIIRRYEITNEIKLRVESPEVSLINLLVQEIQTRFDTRTEDPKYGFLNKFKTELEASLACYKSLQQKQEEFITSCLETMCRNLSKENLQQLTDADRDPVITWVLQLIDTILTGLAKLLPSNEPKKAYYPQLFASSTEVQVATAAQTTHDQLAQLIEASSFDNRI